MALLFENETCSRCSGSGKYSYCQRYGDRCFKCHGAGVTLTKRGHIAQTFYIESCQIEATDLKIGDVIKVDSITHGGQPYSYKAPVIELGRNNEPIRGGHSLNGVFIDTTYYPISVKTKSPKFGEHVLLCPYNMKFRAYRTDDKSRIEAALAFQATLTKNGIVKKRGKNETA